MPESRGFDHKQKVRRTNGRTLGSTGGGARSGRQQLQLKRTAERRAESTADQAPLEWKNLVLARLELIGMEEVGFGLTGMDWTEGNRLWSDWNAQWSN
jgi:hypothetical protein